MIQHWLCMPLKDSWMSRRRHFSQSMSHTQLHTLIFVTFMCLFVRCCTSSATPLDYKYSVFMDGGSTSTKLRVYKWQTPSSRDDIPHFTQISVSRHTPGISEYSDNLTAIASYIRPMIHESMELVPKDLHKITPIYFMATAGLRVLKGQMSLKIIRQLNMFLENSENNPFLFRRGQAQVLSGEEEAVFAWIAVNYLRGFFHKQENTSVGVLEMGGGSTQIVFVPKTPIYANKFIAHIGSTYYHTYAHSYLNFGQAYLIERVQDHLLQQSGTNDSVLDPCRLRGDNTTVSDENGRSIVMIGNGNAESCREILEDFLNKQPPSDCSPKPCSIGTTYQSPLGDTIFYAVSAFVYPTNQINSTDADERLNMDLMIKNTKTYCEMTIDEAVEVTGANPKYASNNCISGVFIPLLLKNAYGFPQNTTSIYMKKKINNKSPDWSLGALIYQSEQKRDECEVPSLTAPTTTITNSGSLKLSLTNGMTAIFAVFIFHLYFLCPLL
ncbi:ectonucleoside triphosphate diphosphohydrolase 8 isoform X1 [Octopus sinensis]|uniref:Ectonucleoside triphosphate diphosphohydrolase 8 isoform X1 n=3 Tax=Octopus sinensis TaxID=2607531 RepID=A0A6P7SV32_9MOLL|nr:ectonucleoside triphosphate diphosphohydrolase 8 isoform X1 [Octopus sinensis]XP_036362471.1 ectonucleoside triphosphate diphosphohydrolase 8 isoform X1 [Octopus sinensis]